MLKNEYQTEVYEDMILEVGDFLLKINKVSVKSIHWQLYQDEENEEEIVKKVSNFRNNDKIKFGRRPGGKNDIEINDSDIQDKQGYFKKKLDKVYVMACNNKYPYAF